MIANRIEGNDRPGDNPIAVILVAESEVGTFLDDPLVHARIAAWHNMISEIVFMVVDDNGEEREYLRLSPAQSRTYTQERIKGMLGGEFRDALNFFQGSEDPSVVTNHLNHGFVMANPLYRMDVEIVPPSEMYGVYHDRPFTWQGRKIDPHWGYQPQRLVDLVQELNQSKVIENFKYRSVNPAGHIIEWTMDYRLFDLGSGDAGTCPVRISRHREIQVVGTI